MLGIFKFQERKREIEKKLHPAPVIPKIEKEVSREIVDTKSALKKLFGNGKP